MIKPATATARTGRAPELEPEPMELGRAPAATGSGEVQLTGR
jgi:hypothetical protein